MIRTISKTIVVPAGTVEKTEVIVVGGGDKQKTIRGVYYETVANVHVRVNVGNDRICEVSGDIPTDETQPIEINRPLADGEIVTAGYWDGTGAGVTHDIAVQIEEAD